MKIFKFTVYVKPKPFVRPKFNSLNKCVFDDPGYSAFKTAVRFAAQKAMRTQNISVFSGNVSAEVKFFKNCKSVSSKSFGDIDNLLKALFDSFNNTVFFDDSQVVKVSAKKIADPCDRIEVKISEVI